MFDSFRKFLSEVSEGGEHPIHFDHDDYRLAAAALLVHAAAIDGDVSDVERGQLHAIIKRQFGLDEATTDELVVEATEAEHEAIDLYHFTRAINRSLDEDGRRRVVEMRWEIDVVLVARREQALAALADAIAAKGTTRPTVLPADLARADATQSIAEALDRRGLEPDVVVNNAGFGLLGAADTLDRAEQLAMIDLDVRALTDLSLAFIDSLKRRRGGILNVASIAAFMPGPGMAIYYASKAYVLSFSEALHQELKPKGVRVTVLCPGPVPTEFQARAGLGADALPRILTRSAEQVARDAYRGLKQGRRVVVPGFANSVMTTLTRFAPRGLLLDLIDRQQRGRR